MKIKVISLDLYIYSSLIKSTKKIQLKIINKVVYLIKNLKLMTPETIMANATINDMKIVIFL